MVTTKQRLTYLMRSLAAIPFPRRYACPSCAQSKYTPVHRKMLVTALVRCDACKLLYRVPTDPPRHNFAFYQKAYTFGYTTDCPAPEQIKALLATGFRDSERDASEKIDVLRALGVTPGARVLDFGASWGYATWQLRAAGFDASGYEISQPRARYAREVLSVPVADAVDALTGPVDVFYSSHVMEHVPSAHAAITLARRLLKPGGLFVSFTPNGSFERLHADPREYHANWGFLHPQFLDEAFYAAAFPGESKLAASSPYSTDDIQRWDHRTDVTMNLRGGELLFVAQV